MLFSSAVSASSARGRASGRCRICSTRILRRSVIDGPRASVHDGACLPEPGIDEHANALEAFHCVVAAGGDKAAVLKHHPFYSRSGCSCPVHAHSGFRWKTRLVEFQQEMSFLIEASTSFPF